MRNPYVISWVNENTVLKRRIKRLKIAFGMVLILLFSCVVALCTAGDTKAVKTPDREEIKADTVFVMTQRSIVEELARLDSLSSISPSDSTVLAFIEESGIQHPYIVLAQMKIESGNYKSRIAKKNNNYFGMRHPTLRLSVSLGSKNGYARYRNWAYSILDYALWQRRYAWNLTEEEYLTKLSSVYAEDPNYTVKVKNIAKNLENEK